MDILEIAISTLLLITTATVLVASTLKIIYKIIDKKTEKDNSNDSKNVD